MRIVANMNWQETRLGDVLTRTQDRIGLLPSQEYSELTVKLWGKGVVLRRRAPGSEIAHSTRFRVSTGQFVLSRIDARNGAMGLVPSELNGAIVSSDFPVFRVAQERLHPGFLSWLCRTRSFVDLCKAASEGTTNRVRLQENRFLSLPISLPPLAEQRRIVAKIEALAAKIEEARGLRASTSAEAGMIVQAIHLAIESHLPNKCPTKRLAQLIERHDSGWSPQCEDEPVCSGDWGILKTTAVQWPGFDPSQNKALSPGMTPRPEIVVQTGDVLITRAGPVNRVGVACTVRSTPPRLMLSDKIVRVRTNAVLLPEYLSIALASPGVQEYFRQSKTGLAASQVNISRKKLLALELRVPDINTQRRIVTHLDDLQAKVDRLKALQAETAAELDALLPSILDKAFKGEL